MNPSYFDAGTDRLAYRQLGGQGTGVVFLGGFRSDMTGDKATYLERWAAERGRPFLRFDYHGHGASSGQLYEGSIGRWIDNAREIVAALTQGPQILIGSSMGGWIMLHVARAVAARVHGLIGIAAAPDFTEDLMLAALDPEQQRIMFEQGFVLVDSPYGRYPIPRHFIIEARDQLMLRGRIAVACPVRLLHGTADDAVPWPRANLLAEAIDGPDTQVLLVPDGDHRLSSPPQLALLGEVLERLVHKVEKAA